jgi:hypothetical protein
MVNQKSGVNALGLERVLDLGSYHTAWKWLHKLRKAMVRPERDLLIGMIEADKTFIGGPRSGKRGRGAAGKEPFNFPPFAIATQGTAILGFDSVSFTIGQKSFSTIILHYPTKQSKIE